MVLYDATKPPCLKRQLGGSVRTKFFKGKVMKLKNSRSVAVLSHTTRYGHHTDQDYQPSGHDGGGSGFLIFYNQFCYILTGI